MSLLFCLASENMAPKNCNMLAVVLRLFISQGFNIKATSQQKNIINIMHIQKIIVCPRERYFLITKTTVNARV